MGALRYFLGAAAVMSLLWLSCGAATGCGTQPCNSDLLTVSGDPQINNNADSTAHPCPDCHKDDSLRTSQSLGEQNISQSYAVRQISANDSLMNQVNHSLAVITSLPRDFDKQKNDQSEMMLQTSVYDSKTNQPLDKDKQLMGYGNRSIDQGNQSMDQGNQSMDQGNQSIDQGNQSMDQGNQSMGYGNRSIDQGNQSMGEDNQSMDQGKQLMGEDNQSIDQGNQLMDQGNQSMNQSNQSQAGMYYSLSGFTHEPNSEVHDNSTASKYGFDIAQTKRQPIDYVPFILASGFLIGLSLFTITIYLRLATIKLPIASIVKKMKHLMRGFRKRNQRVYEPVYPPVYKPFCAPVYAPVHKPVYAPVHKPVYAPVHKPVYAPVRALVCEPVCEQV